MTSTVVYVASPGPPLVITYGWSNSCIALIRPTTLANRTVGLINGSLIRQNNRLGEAPSTFAASMMSGGRAPSAATNRMNVKPSCCQTATMTIVAVAPEVELSQGTAGRGSAVRE